MCYRGGTCSKEAALLCDSSDSLWKWWIHKLLLHRTTMLYLKLIILIFESWRQSSVFSCRIRIASFDFVVYILFKAVFETYFLEVKMGQKIYLSFAVNTIQVYVKLKNDLTGKFTHLWFSPNDTFLFCYCSSVFLFFFPSVFSNSQFEHVKTSCSSRLKGRWRLTWQHIVFALVSPSCTCVT